MQNTEDDLTHASKEVSKITFKDTACFVITFLTPTLVATGHSSLGIIFWRYPEFEQISILRPTQTYVTQIIPFPGTNLIAIANDSRMESGDIVEVYNYETKKRIWANEKHKINSRKLTTVSSDTLCGSIAKKLCFVNILTNQTENVPISEEVQQIDSCGTNSALCIIGKDDFTLTRYNIHDMQHSKAWTHTFQGLEYHSSSLSPHSIFIQCKPQKIIEMSFHGDLLRTIVPIHNVKERIGYIDRRYMGFLHTYKIKVFDMRENEKLPFEYNVDGHYVHDMAVAPSGNGIVFAVHFGTLYFAKIRDEIPQEQLEMMRRMRTSREVLKFCDLVVFIQ
jgi:hypothetical protein